MWFGRGGWGVRLVGVDGVVGLGGVVGVIRETGSERSQVGNAEYEPS